MPHPRHIERMTRVIEYLYAHLDDDLSLERVADVAHVSACHFHRLYQATTGETLADTVRRLRFHRAAGELFDPACRLVQIARRAGYSSAEAFSRAFKQRFGITPSAYRTQTTALHPAPSLTLNPEAPVMDDMHVETLCALELLAVRHGGDYMKIGQAFDRLCLFAGPRGLLGPGTRMIGAGWDDPAVVPVDDLRSAACIVAPHALAEGAVVPLTLPAGRYACHVHVGPYAGLATAYQRVFAWIARQDLTTGAAPCFEEYLNHPVSTPPMALETRIMVPLLD